MTSQILDFQLIGQVGNYIAKTHEVKPFNTVYTSNSAIKLYSMRTNPGKPFSVKTMDIVGELISKKIETGEINPRIGMGFAIASKNLINVSIWGGAYPSLLNNNLFEFDKITNIKETISPLDINKFGTYCVWELGIVNHESSAWMQYLYSEKAESDKLRYIEEVFKGAVV